LSVIVEYVKVIFSSNLLTINKLCRWKLIMTIRNICIVLEISILFCLCDLPLRAFQSNKDAHSSTEETDTNNTIDYSALMIETADNRDDVSPIFEQGLKAGYLDALWHLGQIGTERTCQRLTRYLRFSQNEVRLYAASGAAMCGDKISTPALILQIDREKDALIKGELLRALGFTGRSDIRNRLIDVIMSEKAPEILDGALEGLMQNIVYSDVSAGDLLTLDYQKLIKFSVNNKAETTAFRAAYLLTRIRKLDDVLSFADLKKAFAKSKLENVKILLLRTISRLMPTDQQIEFLLDVIDDVNGKLRFEAISGLGKSQNIVAKHRLLAFIKNTSNSVAERQAALTALGGSFADGVEMMMLIKELSQSSEQWLAVSAMRVGVASGNEWFVKRAGEWLVDVNYYKAFQAVNMLANSDVGKALLNKFINNGDSDLVRVKEAKIALDPSIEARTVVRPSPNYADLSEEQSRLILKTTRGDIVIETHASAPFTAHNFITLAKEGKMNGMLWHRVIPNFVAQAGQKEDESLYDWGSIREEWAGGTHTVGSVGVATAGKDTGSTQFFINTHRNLHLDGRYTVFAHVTEGMEIVEALQEGDVIETVVVEGLAKTES
jgi:cyclophilin family peptidyl-prolyl cis-trans isomerase/HEAT repeat protein